MVSALWKACSEGRLESVCELLREATSVDIEIKDHTGVTPLIEAIRNGHNEVVKALLDKGADPTNGSSQGRPEQYTSDPAILESLALAQGNLAQNGMPANEQPYPHVANDEPEKQYYGAPQGAYPYYPSLNSAPPPMADGAMYYPPPAHLQSAGDGHTPGGPGNLPPPEVARFIPCRYFPACRYGASCMFAHPQAPYFQGPMPAQAPYAPPYDPMSPGYAPNYYPVHPPSFQPPNGVQHITPLSPPPSAQPILHARSSSEIVSPAQGHFSPNGVHHQLPYGPMSPPTYPQSAHMPIPMAIPPLPAIHHPTPPQGPQSPTNMYHNSAPALAPFPVQQDSAGQYPPPTPGAVPYPDPNGTTKPPSQPEAYGPGPNHRDGMGHHRRGSNRRGSFGGRKPPCLFFPAGRCKNGDECRFPHITPENAGPNYATYFSGRGGAPRPRPPINGNNFGTIEENLAGISIRDESPRQQNGVDGSSRSQSTDPGSRPRFPPSAKPNHGITNGARPDKRVVKQRVPNADEFPVLTGSTTPPARSPGVNGYLPNGIGHSGPTAAQVLQAPPPARKDSSKGSSTRGATPDLVQPAISKETPSDINGIVEPSVEQPVHKLPISFAAVANSTPDVSKEVSVSA
ncbi:hypothetical protein BD779DRAFT_49362 [Infundibulicybe gibba]|nr:hypothetical protein BD779DRAFT_49362 [Infundibulicybe gibba]